MTTETSTAGAGPPVVAVVLAAGFGTRLRPLTLLRPKPLCPVANVALVDAVIDRVAPVTPRVAVNVHAGRAQIEQHFDAGRDGTVPSSDEDGLGGSGRDVPVHLSFEEPHVLGTAGALGQLRWWIDGAAALVVNGDSWTATELHPFVSAWDGERVSVLVHDTTNESARGRAAFTPRSELVATLLPWREVRTLEAEPSGLYERCLAPAAGADRLAVTAADEPFFDCGTPRSYLQANLAAAAVTRSGSLLAAGAVVRGEVDQSVVGDAVVDGRVTRGVVWSGASVGPSEVLRDAIRTDAGRTVLVR